MILLADAAAKAWDFITDFFKKRRHHTVEEILKIIEWMAKYNITEFTSGNLTIRREPESKDEQSHA